LQILHILRLNAREKLMPSKSSGNLASCARISMMASSGFLVFRFESAME